MRSVQFSPSRHQSACCGAARHVSAASQQHHGRPPAVALRTAYRLRTTGFKGSRGYLSVATRAKETIDAASSSSSSSSDVPTTTTSSSSTGDSAKKQPNSKTSGQLFVEDEDGDMVINDEELKRFVEEKGPWLVFLADVTAFTFRQALWLAPLLLLAEWVNYDINSHISWSLPALEAGLTAALPALALVAVQELGPWAKLPDQQQYARYVQLLEEVNESQLVNQTDLDEVSSGRRLGESGWPALAAGLDTFQRVNFTEGVERVAGMPAALQVWDLFKDWARPALVPVAFKGLLLSTAATAILEQVAAHGTDTSGLFFWARLFGVANPVVALWLSVPAALLVLAPVQANLRFGQHNPYRIFTRLALLQLEVVGRLAPAMWLVRYSLQGTAPLSDDKGRAFTYRRGKDLMQQRRNFFLGDWAEQQPAEGARGAHAATPATSSSSTQQQALPASRGTSSGSSGSSKPFSTREAVIQEVQLRYQLLQKSLKGLDKRLADLAEIQVQEETSRANSPAPSSSSSSLEEEEEGRGASKPKSSAHSGGGQQTQQQQRREHEADRERQKQEGDRNVTTSSSSSSSNAASSLRDGAAGADQESSGPPSSSSSSGGSSSSSHHEPQLQHAAQQENATGSTSGPASRAAAAGAGGGGGHKEGAADAAGSASPNISTAVVDSAQRAVWDTALSVLEQDKEAIYLVSMLEDVMVKEKDGQPVSLLQAAEQQRDELRQKLEKYSDIVASASDTSDDEGEPHKAAKAAAAPAAAVTSTVAAADVDAASPSSSSSNAAGRDASTSFERQQEQQQQQHSEVQEAESSKQSPPQQDPTHAAPQPEQQGSSSSSSSRPDGGEEAKDAAGQREQLESAMEGYLRGLYKAVVKDNKSNEVLEDHAATVLAFAETGRVSTAADAALVRWMVLVALVTDLMACGGYAATGGNLVAAGAAVTAVQLGQAAMRYIGLQRWVAAAASWPAVDSSDSSGSEEDE